MAKPNLISPWYNYNNSNERLTAIYGRTNYNKCPTGWTLLLDNPAGSGAVYKVNALSVIFNDYDNTPTDIAAGVLGDIGIVNNSEIHVFTNSTGPGSSSGYLYDRLQPYSYSHRWDGYDSTYETQSQHQYLPLSAPNVGTRWKVISKDEMFYLQEGERIYIYNNLERGDSAAVISYEEVIGRTTP